MVIALPLACILYGALLIYFGYICHFIRVGYNEGAIVESCMVLVFIWIALYFLIKKDYEN